MLSTENSGEFTGLNSGYRREFLPATPAERHYVPEISESQWRAKYGASEPAYRQSVVYPLFIWRFLS